MRFKQPLLLMLGLGVSMLALCAGDLQEAKALIEAKRVPEARPLLEKQVAEPGAGVEAFVLLARCQVDMGDREAAIATAEKGLALEPEHLDLMLIHGLSCMDVAGKQRSLSLLRKGREQLLAVLKRDPKNLDARYTLIGYYTQAPFIAGGSTAKAIAQAEALRREFPDRGLMSLIGIHVHNREWQKAWDLCAPEIPKQQGNYWFNFEVGRIASQSGKHLEEGLGALKRCLEVRAPEGAPSAAKVQYHIGLIERALGRENLARAAFEEARRLSPEDGELGAKLSEALKRS